MLPAPLLDRIQSVRRHWWKPDPRIAVAQEKFAELNHSLPTGRIAMRPGIVWNVDPQSQEAFTWFCYQSPEMVAELDFFLRISADRKRFLDLGANHGVFSLAFTFGRPEAKALAVDPSPLAFPILQNNLRLNPQCQITPVQVAAGSASGTLRMKLNWHHLEVIPDQTAPESDQIKIVPVRTVDSICEENNFEPDLIKIDIEGHELAALQGMEKTLRKNRVEFFLEIHPELISELHYQVSDITDYLQKLGYEPWNLQGEKVSFSWVNDQIHVFWVFCRPAEAAVTSA